MFFSEKSFITSLPGPSIYYDTYSFVIGTDPRRFGFIIMFTWFRSCIFITEGRRRHGSPSTCIGMGFVVVSRTSLH